MEPDDPDKWLEHLTGKSGDAHPRTEKLRAAIQRMEARQPVGDPPPLSALLFRLRREGLLDKPTAFWRQPALLAMAASVAVVSITISLWHTTDESELDETRIVRALPTQQRFEVADPEASALGLSNDLKALGVVVRIEREGNDIAVMFTVPEPLTPALAKELTRLGVKDAKGKQRFVIVLAKKR